MGESPVSLRAIRSVRISVVVGAVLLGAGLLSYFYVTTDPNPEWWAANYPWMRFVTLSLLFGGVLTSTVGTSLAFLETVVFLDQGLVNRVDKMELAFKKPSLNPRKERIRESKPATRFPMESSATKRAIVLPAN